MLVPVVIANLGIAESEMGLIILAGGIAAIIALAASPVSIALAGVRRVILIAGFLLSPGLFLIINTNSFWFAIFMVMAVMAGLATQDVAMNADAGDLENESGRTIMSSFHGFWSVGAMTGALLGGPVLASFGPNTLALGVGILVCGVAIAVSPNLSTKATADGEGMPRTLPKALLPWLFGIIAFTGFVSEGAVMDWSAHFFRSELASGITLSGLAFGAFSFTMMLARFTGDRLRDHFGEIQIFVGSVLLAALGLALVVLSPTAIIAAFGFALAGFGNANIVPIAFSAASRIKNLPKGSGIAVATFGGYAGLLFAPASLGIIGEIYGFRTVFGLMALLLVATLVLTPNLRKKT